MRPESPVQTAREAPPRKAELWIEGHGAAAFGEPLVSLHRKMRTYQRVARSLRQTLALKTKLKRDREAAAKDAPAKPPGGVAVARRLRELRQAVSRIIWNEAERADDPTFLEDAEEAMEELVAHEMPGEAFCAEALDDHVARVCLALDLPPEEAERWRDLPDPPHDPPDRRSSA